MLHLTVTFVPVARSTWPPGSDGRTFCSERKQIVRPYVIISAVVAAEPLTSRLNRGKVVAHHEITEGIRASFFNHG